MTRYALVTATLSCVVVEAARLTEGNWLVRVDVQGDGEIAGQPIETHAGGEYVVGVVPSGKRLVATVGSGPGSAVGRWLAEQAAVHAVFEARRLGPPAPLLPAEPSALPRREPTPEEQRLRELLRSQPANDAQRSRELLRQRTLDDAARLRGDAPRRRR
jgi:hypothetical protein